MRSDMQKVIVERPRWGHSLRSKKTARRIRPIEVHEDYDSGPTRAPSRRDEKEFNEHLQPLWRFVRSNLGKPWDKVYSEIRRNISGRGVLGNHLLDHLHWEVETECRLIDGKVVVLWGGRPSEVWGFYVHPRTGLLQEAPRRRWRRFEREEPVSWVQGPDEELYHRVGELWFHVEIVRCEPRRRDRGIENLASQLFFEHLEPRVREILRDPAGVSARLVKRQCNRKTVRWIHQVIELATKKKRKVVRRGPVVWVPAGSGFEQAEALAA